MKSQVKVLVRIDYEALMRGFVEPGEVCEIDGIGPVSVASAEALMDNAFIAALITKGHDVCTVAHLGRAPNAHQRTALEWLAPKCTNSRCPNRRWREIDHRQPWADTHHTTLDELDDLCETCHDRKTHRGWTLDEGTGRRPLRSPDERNQRAGPDPPQASSSQETLGL